jgi:hypothetical protein
MEEVLSIRELRAFSQSPRNEEDTIAAMGRECSSMRNGIYNKWEDLEAATRIKK